MIAAVIPARGAALETGDAAGDDRRLAEPWRPFDAGEFVVRRFGELHRQRLLRGAEHVDREMAGVLEDRQPLREHAEAPQHQRWIERYRSKGVAGHPVRLSIIRHCGDDGNAGTERAKRVAKVPGIDG